LGGRGSGGRTLAGDEEGEEDGDEEEDEDCCPEDEVHVHVVWVCGCVVGSVFDG